MEREDRVCVKSRMCIRSVLLHMCVVVDVCSVHVRVFLSPSFSPHMGTLHPPPPRTTGSLLYASCSVQQCNRVYYSLQQPLD